VGRGAVSCYITHPMGGERRWGGGERRRIIETRGRGKDRLAPCWSPSFGVGWRMAVAVAVAGQIGSLEGTRLSNKGGGEERCGSLIEIV